MAGLVNYGSSDEEDDSQIDAASSTTDVHVSSSSPSAGIHILIIQMIDFSILIALFYK